jgi:mRNA-degrading endonuclease toxin of MazEF toxin-antitoxin module
MNTTTINKIDCACKKYKKIHQSGYIKFDKLDDWLDKESTIFENEITNDKKTFKKLKRGQIIKVNFGINIGSELCYTHFAIVINKNDSIYSDNICVVPITSKKGKDRIRLGRILHLVYPNSKKYNLQCYANISQIKTISKTRIFQDNKNYICNDEILDKIDNEIIKEFTNIKNND